MTVDPRSITDLCKQAWHTYYGMQKAGPNFDTVGSEVWCLAIALDCLHSMGRTAVLISRQKDSMKWSLAFSKILQSLHAVLQHLHNFVKTYMSTPRKHRAKLRSSLTATSAAVEGVGLQDSRRKLALLLQSLTDFLISLTHAELARSMHASEVEEYRVLTEFSSSVPSKSDGPTSSHTRSRNTRQTMSSLSSLETDVHSRIVISNLVNPSPSATGGQHHTITRHQLLSTATAVSRDPESLLKSEDADDIQGRFAGGQQHIFDRHKQQPISSTFSSGSNQEPGMMNASHHPRDVTFQAHHGNATAYTSAETNNAFLSTYPPIRAVDRTWVLENQSVENNNPTHRASVVQLDHDPNRVGLVDGQRQKAPQSSSFQLEPAHPEHDQADERPVRKRKRNSVP